MDCKANIIYTGISKTVSFKSETYSPGSVIAGDGGLSEIRHLNN